MPDEPRQLLDATVDRHASVCGPHDLEETDTCRCGDPRRAVGELADALRAVLDEHTPTPIYAECGHDHDEGEAGVVDIDPIGLVCQDGYMYDICRECCMDADEQIESCADHHDNRHCWPCRTVRKITKAIGGDEK